MNATTNHPDSADSRDLIARLVALLGDVAPEIPSNDVDPDASLRDAYEIDSMDYLALLERVADELGVEVPEADYDQAQSLTDLAQYIREHRP